jgi:hypothetical protein
MERGFQRPDFHPPATVQDAARKMAICISQLPVVPEGTRAAVARCSVLLDVIAVVFCSVTLPPLD